ncbi:ankyrin repeat-containing domain protein [Morchella snyderi]|nr:ankyrin repeat-containing domain protein [Morchella snyderi]
MSFTSLPAELHLLIATHLPPHSLLSVILTCRRYHSLYLPHLLTIAHDPKGSLPALHWSIVRNYPNLTKYLLATKPTLINTTTADGWTPLHYAVAQGLPAAITLLLDHGADVNQRDYIGAAPLDHAPSFAPEDRFDLLRRFPSYQPCGDRKPVGRWHVWHGEQAYEEIARRLLAAGADPNNQDFFGRTALFWAARVGVWGVARALVEAGADVNLATRDGETALMAAVGGCRDGVEEEGRVRIVEMLVAAGVDFEAVNGAGGEIFGMAVRGGARRIMRLLVEAREPGQEAWTNEEIIASGR